MKTKHSTQLVSIDGMRPLALTKKQIIAGSARPNSLTECCGPSICFNPSYEKRADFCSQVHRPWWT